MRSSFRIQANNASACQRRAALRCMAYTNPHVQLGTAKLPSKTDPAIFSAALYNWASSITSTGKNLPLALPIRVDRTDAGFTMAFLKSQQDNRFASVGTIDAAVEPVDGHGNILFIRFCEGDTLKDMDGAKKEQQLKIILEGLVDVPTIMRAMPDAIRSAVVAAS